MKTLKVLSLALIFLFVWNAVLTAQDKLVLLDISLEDKSEYVKVSPNIFEHYKDVVENQLGANLIINEGQEVDRKLLEKTDVLVVLSTLSSTDLKRSRTETEIKSIVSFVKNGGRLIFFTDEDQRVNIDAFGANQIVNPFGLEFGNDLPKMSNAGAISFIGEFIKDRYELPYSGSRELTGGIPLSVMNAEGAHLHGAYVKLENSGKLAAFGETMVGLFIGGVEFTLPNGNSIVWKGKDNKQFMKELIAWTLED